MTIDSTAIVSPSAQIGSGCSIGPYCIVGPNVVLGESCTLHPHVVINGHTKVGARNEFYPFACVGLKTQDLKWKGGVTRLEIGEANIFREYVTVNSATSDGNTTRVGSHNALLAYSHVAHDCTLGNHIVMSNAATLAGHIVVEDYAIVGGLAAVHQFCRIGKMSIIGGCSKVVQDVPPFMLVDGNPGQTRTINKVGLERNGVSEEVQTALKSAYRILFRDGLATPNAIARIKAELPAYPELQHLMTFVAASERGLCR